MTRFTLSFTTDTGNTLTLYNLGRPAVDQIVRVQKGFGSTDFVEKEQARTLTNEEVDTAREQAENDRLFNGTFAVPKGDSNG